MASLASGPRAPARSARGRFNGEARPYWVYGRFWLAPGNRQLAAIVAAANSAPIQNTLSNPEARPAWSAAMSSPG